MGNDAKLIEMQKWSNENLHLDNAQKLRGIYFIDPEDKEFKETIKNARKKLETSVALAMLSKIMKNCGSGASNKIKTKLACTLEADESTRMRMGNSIPHHHEDHITGETWKFITALQFGSQIYSSASSYENSCSESSGGQGMGKIGENFGMELGKSQNKKELIDEARTSGAKVHFASLMDICHLKNAELEAKHQKYKGRVVLRGDIVRGDSGSYAEFTEQGSSASEMTAGKVMDIIARLPGCDGQAGDAVFAETHVRMEDAPKLLKIPKSECPDNWICLPRHKWPKSWFSMEHSVVLLERNLCGHLLAGLIWERQFWENSFAIRLGESFQLRMLFRTPWKKGVCVDDFKFAGHKQDANPMWKVLTKEVDLGEPTCFFDHVYLGCTERQCAGATQRLPFFGNYSYFFVVLWHGRSCKEVCGTILWVGEQNDSTTLQSINSLHWRPSFQRRRNEISWRIVTSMLSIVLKSFFLVRIGKTWYSLVSGQTCTIVYILEQSMWQTLESIDILQSSHVNLKQYCCVVNTAKQCRLENSCLWTPD